MKITFATSDGFSRTINAENGRSFMEVAVDNEVPGISADCGGNAMCATCHVHVAADDFDRLPAMADDEREMLEVTRTPARPTSRLACQLRVDEALGPITVEVPVDDE